MTETTNAAVDLNGISTEELIAALTGRAATATRAVPSTPLPLIPPPDLPAIGGEMKVKIGGVFYPAVLSDFNEHVIFVFTMDGQEIVEARGQGNFQWWAGGVLQAPDGTPAE